MEFSLFLSPFYPDTDYPAAKLYAETLEQAKLAEQLGFCGVTVPEHQFINILMVPDPLMFAIRVADVTERITITTAVLVLPLRDMKRLAGSITLADNLTGGRLQLGVGRGAFRYEFDRFAVPIETSRAHFDESLAVLEALLSREEVSWDGEHYSFDALTVMPRPLQRPHPPIWIAALAPEAIYHSARRGYHVQTTPLKPSPEFLKTRAAERGKFGESIPFGDVNSLIAAQADGFRRGIAEAGEKGVGKRLSLLRVGFVTADEADARDKAALSRGYYQRFANMRESPGTVSGGAVAPVEIADSDEELYDSLIIGTPERVVEKLRPYQAMGFDEINLNMNIGAPIAETLASIERFATQVMPHFAAKPDLSETG